MLPMTGSEMSIQRSQHPMPTRSMIQKQDQQVHRNRLRDTNSIHGKIEGQAYPPDMEQDT